MSPADSPAAKSKPKSDRPAGKAPGIAVMCGMEGCDHASQLRFQGDSPFDGFRFDTEGWTVVEDTEEKRTVFLCTDCAREFEQELASDEDGDLEDDDEELEDEPEGP
jgi:hypothetical protein